jgi:hypothetical protein
MWKKGAPILIYLPRPLKIKTTRATTTITSKIGIHAPPYPSIIPPPQEPPFIIFPLCANVTPADSRVTVPTTIASKDFITPPSCGTLQRTLGRLWRIVDNAPSGVLHTRRHKIGKYRRIACIWLCCVDCRGTLLRRQMRRFGRNPCPAQCNAPSS